MRVALGLEYDGRSFEGWQTQPSGQTVQDYLEAAVVQFTGEKVKAVCAWRTDANVHATGQVIHLDTGADRKEISWVRGLNSYQDVCSSDLARFSACSRTYEYWIVNEPVRSPILSGRTGWVFRPLNEKNMEAAGQFLVGEHDFSSFRAAGCQSKTPVKNIEYLHVIRLGRFIKIRVKANAFLYHMVRNIVGCLVYVGTGARSVDWMGEVLEAKSRQAAAPTFYPTGLYLTGVGYPEIFGLPQHGASPFPG